MKATPGPSVSGRNFFPNAPLLCTKRTPDCCVTSRNVTAELAAGLPLLPPPTAADVASANAANSAESPLMVSSLLVAPDAQGICHAIDVIEPRRDQSNLQNAAVVEANGYELRVIVRRNFGVILVQRHYAFIHHYN